MRRNVGCVRFGGVAPGVEGASQVFRECAVAEWQERAGTGGFKNLG